MAARGAHDRANVGRLPLFSSVSLLGCAPYPPPSVIFPISSRFHLGNSRQWMCALVWQLLLLIVAAGSLSSPLLLSLHPFFWVSSLPSLPPSRAAYLFFISHRAGADASTRILSADLGVSLRASAASSSFLYLFRFSPLFWIGGCLLPEAKAQEWLLHFSFHLSAETPPKSLPRSLSSLEATVSEYGTCPWCHVTTHFIISFQQKRNRLCTLTLGIFH